MLPEELKFMNNLSSAIDDASKNNINPYTIIRFLVLMTSSYIQLLEGVKNVGE